MVYKYIGSIQKHEIVTIINKTCFSLRVSDYCLTPNEQFFSYIMASTIYIRWNVDLYFVIDHHALLDLSSFQFTETTVHR
jgi:hypothetical protein